MNALARVTAPITLAFLAMALTACPSLAEKHYGPGVTDTTIKIGQTMPYSGPVSARATLGRAEAAYFDMINERGGIHRRKLELISLDDGYSPPRTVERTRELVEQHQVLLLFSSFGTPTNTAILKYTNARHVPHLFLAAIGTRWADPDHFPWSLTLWPDQRTGAGVHVQYLIKDRPRARVAVLYQNDDYGKGYLQLLKDGLAQQRGISIVAEASYEVSDPTVDSQIITLQSSKADTLLTVASPKFAALAIRKVYEVGWKPHHVVSMPGSSVASVLKAAGLERAIGLVAASFLKDPTDPQWRDDVGMREWTAWMRKYYPEGDLTDWYNVFGYTLAQAMVHVLQQCGDDLTRENVMKQATSLSKVALPMLLPGITITTSSTDYVPIKLMHLMRFDGRQWASFGELSGR